MIFMICASASQAVLPLSDLNSGFVLQCANQVSCKKQISLSLVIRLQIILL